MSCNIQYKSDGTIDHVLADNGQKSKLFEDLRNVVGDDNATDYYALTKSGEFQTLMDTKTYSEKTEFRDYRVSVINRKHILEGNTANTIKAFENYSGLILPMSPKFSELEELVSRIELGEVVDKIPYNLILEDYGVTESDVRKLISTYTNKYDKIIKKNDDIASEKGSDNNEIKYEVAEIKGVTSHMFVQNNEVVGSLRTKPFNGGFKVDTVTVRDNYRGQGVGTELYYETVRNLMIQGKKMYSDDAQTEFAHRIWKKLVSDGLAIRTSKFNFETVEPITGLNENTTIDDIISTLKGLTDQNNEPTVSEVLRYSNTSQESLNKAQLVDAIDAATSFGVTNSTELNFLLEKVFIENGAFVFDKKRMLTAGFTEYEVTKILSNPKLQSAIKDNFSKLKNTEFEIVLSDNLVPSDKLNSFGKQKLVPNTEPVQTEVYTIGKEGLEIKQTDTRDILSRTYPSIVGNLSEKFSRALKTAINVREDVGEEKLQDLKTLAKYISKEALEYGVDLRGLENKVFPVKRFSNFVSELAKYITDPNDNFADVYDDFMEVQQHFSNEVVNENEVVLDSTLSELEIFENHNLVRKNGNVFTAVDSVSLEELIENVKEPANISELGLSEFNFNKETAEKLLLWKKFLGYNVEVQENKKPDFIDAKDLKSNPYKKLTSNGISYVDNSLLTKQKSDVYDTQKPAEKLTQEEVIRSNPDRATKINTDYSYISDGVLMTKNNTEGFVRTPQGLFERFYESGDLSFFSQVENVKEKPLSNIDLSQFENNKSLTTDFIKAKEYYTNKELEDINNKYFNCK